MSGKVLKSVQITNSSTVLKVAYTDESNLIITYIKGVDYLYKDVPEATFDQILKAESVGKFINSNIKGKFEYIQLLPTGQMNK